MNEPSRDYRIDQSRRRFLRYSALSALTALCPCPGFAIAHEHQSKGKVLSFYNIHTQESLKTQYWKNGKYSALALTDINYILRDYRTGEIKSIDPRILDQLYRLRRKIKTHDPFHIISGYRSPETNAWLRKNGKGTAKNSYHMYGKAVDIRLPNFSLSLLRKTAIKLRLGGVGYYARSNFIHMDLGPYRYWNDKG